MSVQLIRKEERLKLLYEGSTFIYRRLDAGVKARLINKHTKNGKFDVGTYNLAILQHCVMGWEQVTDSEGTVCEFERDLVQYLPDELTDKLGDRIQDAVATEEESTKNS